MMSMSKGGAVPQQQLCDYQAASPDEVALVKWTDYVKIQISKFISSNHEIILIFFQMGVSLYERDMTNISLKLRATNEIINYNILHMFPFTSETKCMGIIVQVNVLREYLIDFFELMLIKISGHRHF